MIKMINMASNYINHKMKMKCSGSECRHVYEYCDTEFGFINDPGVAVFECPECGGLTMADVRNVDILRERHDVVYVCEPKYETIAQEYADVAKGEFREYSGDAIVEATTVPDCPVWVESDRDYEAEGRSVIEGQRDAIAHELSTLKNGYLAGVAGADAIRRLEVAVSLSDRVCRFMKEVRSENDFTVEGLTLVEVEGVDPARLVNGVYTRDRCLSILGKMLMRWRLMCREVFFVSPFIGLQYHTDKCESEVRAFWNWLGNVIDLEKTRFITRSATFKTLRKAYDSTGTPLSELEEWNDVNALIAEAGRYDGRKKNNDCRHVKLFAKSHAKFYAGVFDGYVEVMAGSYNLHSGPTLENLILISCTEEKFERDYLSGFGVTLTPGNEAGGTAGSVTAIIETSPKGTMRCRLG